MVRVALLPRSTEAQPLFRRFVAPAQQPPSSERAPLVFPPAHARAPPPVCALSLPRDGDRERRRARSSPNPGHNHETRQRLSPWTATARRANPRKPGPGPRNPAPVSEEAELSLKAGRGSLSMGAPVPVVCRQRHRHRSCSAHASAPSHSGSAAQTLLRPGCVGACTNQHGSPPGPIPSADTPSHCHPPSSLASAVTLISVSLVCARPAKGRSCRPQRGAAELLEAAACFAHALHACAGVCLARDRGATQETQEGRRRRRGQGRGRGQGQGGRRHGRRRLLHAIVDLEDPDWLSKSGADALGDITAPMVDADTAGALHRAWVSGRAVDESHLSLPPTCSTPLSHHYLRRPRPPGVCCGS